MHDRTACHGTSRIDVSINNVSKYSIYLFNKKDNMSFDIIFLKNDYFLTYVYIYTEKLYVYFKSALQKKKIIQKLNATRD